MLGRMWEGRITVLAFSVLHLKLFTDLKYEDNNRVDGIDRRPRPLSPHKRRRMQ
jgi:hypothetical protein